MVYLLNNGDFPQEALQDRFVVDPWRSDATRNVGILWYDQKKKHGAYPVYPTKNVD